MNIADLVATLEGRDIGFTAMMGLADRRMEGMHRSAISATEAASALGIGLGALAAGGLAAVIKQAADYQNMLVHMQANTGLTDAQVRVMSAGIQAMAAETGAPLDQLAKGFMAIHNFGFDAADAMKILEPAMKSALSTGDDVGQVASTLGVALHEFHLSADQAAVSMNVLHLAAQEGNATLGQFVEGTTQAFNMAGAYGVKLQDVAAALSTLTQSGQTARAASNGISSAFQGLVKPTAAAAQYARALSQATGVDLVSDFTAAGLRSRGFANIMEDVRKAMAITAGSTAVQQQALAAYSAQLIASHASHTAYIADMAKMAAALKDPAQATNALFANVRAAREVMLLTGSQADSFTKHLTDMGNAMSGKIDPTQAGFIRQQETLSAMLAKVQANVQILAIQLGTILLPPLSQLVSAIVPVAQNLVSWSNAHPALTRGILAATVAVAGLGAALAAFQFIVAPIVAVLGALSTPLLVIVGAAALLYEAWTHDWGGIQETTMQVWRIVAPVFSALQGAVRELANAFQRGGLQAAFADLPHALAPVGQAIGHVFSSINWSAVGAAVVAGAETLASRLLAWIVTASGPLRTQLGTWARAFVAWIPGAIETFLREWPGMLSRFLDWIAGATVQIARGLAPWAGKFFEWVGPMVPVLLKALAMIPAVLLAFIAETGVAIARKLVEWGVAFVQWIAPMMPGFMNALGRIKDDFLRWISSEAAPTIAKQMGTWVHAFTAWVADVWPGVRKALEQFLTEMVDWIVHTAGPAVLKAGQNLAGSMADGLKTGIKNAGGSLFSHLGGLADGMTNAVKNKIEGHSPSRVFMRIGQDIVDGLRLGIEQNAGRARESMASLARLTTTGLLGGNTTAVGSPIDRTNRGLIDFVSYLRLSANVLDRYVRPVQDVHIKQHEQMITTVAILNTGVLGISTSYVGTYTPAVVTNTLMVSLLELAHLALEIALVAVVAVLAVAALALALLTGRAGTAKDAALALASALKSLVAPNLAIGLQVPDVRPIQQMLDAIKPPSFGAPTGGQGTGGVRDITARLHLVPILPTIPALSTTLALRTVLPRIPAQSTTLVLKAELPRLAPMDDTVRLHAQGPDVRGIQAMLDGLHMPRLNVAGFVAELQARFTATVLTLNINTRAVVESISRQMSTSAITLTVNTQSLATSITRLFAGLSLSIHATLDEHSLTQQITSLAARVSFAMHVQIDSTSIQKKIQDTVNTIKISPLVLSLKIAFTGLGGAGGGGGENPLSFLTNLFSGNRLDLNVVGGTTVKIDPSTVMNVKLVNAESLRFDPSSVMKVSITNAESVRFDANSVLKTTITNSPTFRFDANSTMNVRVISAPTLNVKMAEAVTFNTTTFATTLATSITTAITAAFKNITIKVSGPAGGPGGPGAGPGGGGTDWSKWLGDLLGLAQLLKGLAGTAGLAVELAALTAAIGGLTAAVVALAAAVGVLAAAVKTSGGGKGGNLGIRFDPNIDLRGAFSKQVTEIEHNPITINGGIKINVSLISVISKAATDAQNNGGLLTKLGALAGWLQGKVFDLSLKGGGNPLAGLIVSLAQQVPGVKDVVSALKDAGGKLLGFLFSGGGMAGTLASFGKDLVAAIAKSSIVTDITGAITSAKWADAMVGWIGAVPQRLLGVLQGSAKVMGVKDAIVKAFDGAENWLTGKPVDNIVKGLHDIAGSVKNMLLGGVKAYASVEKEIVAAFSGAEKWLTGKPVTDIVSGLSAIAGGIQAMLQNGAKGIKSVQTAITDAFAGADKWLTKVGEDLISGVIQGMTNKLDDLKTFIQNKIADAVPGWMKDFWNSHSPSQVAAAIGADFTQGLIMGLASQTSGLHAQVQQLASIASGMSTGARAPTFTMHGPGESPTPSYLLPQMPKPNAQAPIIVETRLDGSVLSRSVLDDVVAGQRYRVGLVGEGI